MEAHSQARVQKCTSLHKFTEEAENPINRVGKKNNFMAGNLLPIFMKTRNIYFAIGMASFAAMALFAFTQPFRPFYINMAAMIVAEIAAIVFMSVAINKLIDETIDEVFESIDIGSVIQKALDETDFKSMMDESFERIKKALKPTDGLEKAIMNELMTNQEERSPRASKREMIRAICLEIRPIVVGDNNYALNDGTAVSVIKDIRGIEIWKVTYPSSASDEFAVVEDSIISAFTR